MKLFIVPSWYPSALAPESGSFFPERARILQRAGHEVTIVTVVVHPLQTGWRWYRHRNAASPQTENELLTYRREYLHLTPKAPRRSFARYQRHLIALFQQALRERGVPDGVLVHSSLWAGAALAGELRREAIPMAVSEHLKEFLLPDGFTPFQRNCIRKTYAVARRIIATSGALRTAIAEQFPAARDRLALVPNPADISAFPLRPTTAHPEEPFTLVSIALFRPEKRIDLLLRAFARVRRDHPEIRLHLVGDGPLRRALRRLARRLNLEDSVTFHGYLPKERAVGILHRSHALVLSSDVETFGVVLVEALACGLPVIATRCGGPEDIATEETGLLVPPGDEQALAQALRTMRETHRRYAPQRLRHIAETRYGDQAYVNALEEVWRSLRNGDLSSPGTDP
jgi:glycosyltransferase involved in cell wall biosynthesis